MYLTKSERQLLNLLVRGFPTKDIAAHLDISIGTVHIYTMRLRKKTGIHDTKDKEEVRAFIHANRERPKLYPKLPVTPTQKVVLECLAEGKDYHQVAHELTMNHQTVQNHACEGCKRAGIIGYGRNRLEGIKLWVENEKRKNAPSVTMEDPFF